MNLGSGDEGDVYAGQDGHSDREGKEAERQSAAEGTKNDLQPGPSAWLGLIRGGHGRSGGWV
jgi:hypothetical protein